MTQGLYRKKSIELTNIIKTVCPHDCPSACGLEVQLSNTKEVIRVKGAQGHKYTDGVICAKVARYNERFYHPKRLTKPLRRMGPKGESQFEEISW